MGVFISYSSKDSDKAMALVSLLEEKGMQCWIAPRDINAGSTYADDIEKAICNCDMIVLLYSRDAAKSNWVKGEINTAFSLRKTIIPVRIDDTPADGAFMLMLNQSQWMDAGTDFAVTKYDAAEHILHSAGRTGRPVTHGFPRLIYRYRAAIILFIGVLAICMVGKSVFAGDQYRGKVKLSVCDSCAVLSIGGDSYNFVHVGKDTFMLGADQRMLRLLDEQKKHYGGDKNVDTAIFDDETPYHPVYIPEDYYIAETETVWRLWNSIYRDEGFVYFRLAKHPVRAIKYGNVNKFLTELNSRLVGYDYEFRLPTEAEWEFAAKGGGQNTFYYPGSDDIDDVAEYSRNFETEKKHPARVMRHKPNSLGLYDMSGNVFEYTCSRYDRLPDSLVVDSPLDLPTSTDFAVVRGGSYGCLPICCRITNRGREMLGAPNEYIGFRMVLVKKSFN